MGIHRSCILDWKEFLITLRSCCKKVCLWKIFIQFSMQEKTFPYTGKTVPTFQHIATFFTWATIRKLWRKGKSTLFSCEPSSLVLQVFQVAEWICWHSVIIIEGIYKTLVCNSFLTCKFPVFSFSTFKGLWQFKSNPLISV